MKNKHPNRGFMFNRVKHNPREKVFADLWESENIPCHAINFGYGLLQDLFMIPDPFFGHHHSHTKTVITNRERFIAATVVQWLGSNCGMCFLTQALDKCDYSIIKKENHAPKASGK